MAISASLVIDTSAFRAALEAKKAGIKAANARAAEEIKDLIVSKIQPNCRVKTGNERDGWARDSYVETGGDGIDRAVACNKVDYAPYLNYGTSKMPATNELQIGMSEAVSEAKEIWEKKLGDALQGQ